MSKKWRAGFVQSWARNLPISTAYNAALMTRAFSVAMWWNTKGSKIGQLRRASEGAICLLPTIRTFMS